MKEWLLIKERDGYVRTDGDVFPQGSVLSGLTVEELREGTSPATPVLAALERLKAPRRAVKVRDVELMLAETQGKPFTRAGWVFELKYDGYRLLAARDRGTALLLSRNGNDLTVVFPEVARAVEALPYEGLILDGEVVVLDDDGRPSFGRLQKRGRLTRASEVGRAAVEHPATFFAFDLLGFEGFDLRSLPLIQRKALLRQALPPAGALRFSDHIEEAGQAFFQSVLGLQLEGMVAKKADSAYRGGRSANWIKVRAEKTDDFVVVGYSEPKGARAGFGSLHLANYVGDDLTYAGSAGSGFTARQLDEFTAALKTVVRKDAPCVGPIPKVRGITWVEPQLVVEVRFKEYTTEGLLRQPVFLRVRDDKKVEECARQGKREKGKVGRGPMGYRSRNWQRSKRFPFPVSRFHIPQVQFTNLDKIFWPDEQYTKGDLIEYYRAISPWLLPFLKDRPVVMTRFPDGINGKSFFQKDAPGFAPEWLRTERMWSEDTQREISYFVVDSEAALLYIANLGTIPLHVWGSRVGSLERPDWCIIDFDPKDAPFSDVIVLARALHELCEEIGLPNFVKTSGSSGLHVLVPLGRQVTFEQCRIFAQLLARTVETDHRDIATLARNPSRREGKVYLDFLQNGHGKLLVSPYSARPLPGAPASAPLTWKEVKPGLDPRQFTIANLPARMRRMKVDPTIEVLDLQPDLAVALERLQKRFDQPPSPAKPRNANKARK
ncbi:MAG: DNA ligase D [Gemmatimonadetes bacterium]|nr:DNA ligase D [Gemmatimonadota bacterium]